MFRASFKLILTLVFSLSLFGCAPKNSRSVDTHATPQYFTHTITMQGETLGLISKWYTGSTTNWQNILDENPGLDVARLRLGQSIDIPLYLVTRQDPLPAEFITQANAAKPGQRSVRDSATQQSVTASAQVRFDSNSDTEPMARSEGLAVTTSNLDTMAASEESTDQKLFKAVLIGDATQVRQLVKEGGNPNWRENGRPLLGWAAQNGATEVISALIDSGAKINDADEGGHTPLMRAVDMSQIDATKLLLKSGADINTKGREGRTPLFMSIYNQQGEMLRVLLEAGANPNLTTPDGDSPALIAAQMNEVDAIKALAEAKADFNKSNLIYTPLSYAVGQGDVALTKVILDAGANPNVKPSSAQVPLFQALDNIEIVKLLLDAGVDVNYRDDYGMSALDLAQSNMQTEVAELLSARGATN